jgi:PadR family transcriptional regulator PadR
MPRHGFPPGRRFGPGWGTPLAGLTVPAVLLLLRDRDRHGYLLRDALEATGLIADVDFGNLYRTLRRLEMAGLVASRWEQEGDGPGRRVYTLTPDGRAYLDQAASALAGMRTALTRFFELYEQPGGIDS